MFGEEPGDGVAFLHVEMIDVYCEVFCAGDVVAIVFRSIAAPANDFVFVCSDLDEMIGF